MTPTARSLAHLRAEGYQAQVVERRNPHSKTLLDLFGVIDIIGAHPEKGIIGVQATTGPHVAARRTKSLDEPRLMVWLLAGGTYEIWGWSLQGPRGKRKAWTLRRSPIVLSDFVELKAEAE